MTNEELKAFAEAIAEANGHFSPPMWADLVMAKLEQKVPVLPELPDLPQS